MIKMWNNAWTINSFFKKKKKAKKVVGLHREFLIVTLIVMFCDNLLKGCRFVIRVKRLAFVIALVPSLKVEIWAIKKIISKSPCAK